MSLLPLPVARTPAALTEALASARADGLTVGFVPTMGALHEGHLSLITAAKKRTDVVVASIFVNPAQFAPGEDFDAYPRREARDAGLLADASCDLLYVPDRAAMYPDGFATTVTMAGPAEGLEAAIRPHFFHGVATVVAKLLIQVRPDVAVFGEKDYQQLLVIRRLATDLDLGVDIVGAPTTRETDGLAMSSRNAYLDDAARATAGAMNGLLFAAATRLATGADWRDEEKTCAAALLDAGFDSVDYVAVRDADTLAAFDGAQVSTPGRVLAAARLGDVRLIDNVAVTPAA